MLSTLQQSPWSSFSYLHSFAWWFHAIFCFVLFCFFYVWITPKFVSQDLTSSLTKFRTYIPNCLLNISAWMYDRHLKLYMFNTEFELPSSLPPKPSSPDQTKQLDIILDLPFSPTLSRILMVLLSEYIQNLTLSLNFHCYQLGLPASIFGLYSYI